jgi:hypothetical protein
MNFFTFDRIGPVNREKRLKVLLNMSQGRFDGCPMLDRHHISTMMPIL